MPEMDFKCRACGNVDKVETFGSLNVRENPEIKTKIANGSLFKWICPHCGQVNLACWQTVYHDPDARLLVWVTPPDQISASELEVLKPRMDQLAKSLGDNPEAGIENYELRRVESVGSLIEKIKIRDAGLDDLVVELCKYVTKMEMAEKAPTAEERDGIMAAQMRFYEMHGADNEIVMVFPLKGAMQQVTIGFNVYEDSLGIISRNQGLRPEGFALVDSTLINSMFR